MLNSRVLILFLIVVLAAATRFLPHPPNFTPIAAIALFGGAYFSDKRIAFVLPLAVMILSDLFLGLHGTLLFVYFSLILTIFMGFGMRGKVSFIPVLGGAIGSSILFFIITNFGVWISGAYYPKTLDGFILCYTAAIPFFHHTLAGTLLYSAALFGGFEFMQLKYPKLRYNKIQV
ncbi:MAG: DUF6580 family putative transport protein [Balneolales bacterium]